MIGTGGALAVSIHIIRIIRILSAAPQAADCPQTCHMLNTKFIYFHATPFQSFSHCWVFFLQQP